MEKIFCALGIIALVWGGVEGLQYMEDERLQDALHAIYLGGAGLSLLAIYEVIKVLKQIRDGVKPE